MSGCDAQVVECARRGDAAAFACLVESYQRPIFNLCFRMLGEAGEAEDATQETFLRVYLRLPSYDPRRGFKNWLFAVAAHYCIDCLRRRRWVWQPWEAEQEYPDAPGGEPGPELAALRADEQRAAQMLLARLGPKDRAVVVMHYWGDLSYAEMAEATGASLGAVKSRLHRARAKLSAAVRPSAPYRQCLPVLE